MKKLIYKVVYAAFIAVIFASCKKDPSPSIEVAIAADEVYHQNVSVDIREIWLNYATKKSKSEWMKLEIAPGLYDLADLYADQRDTIILAQTPIEDAQTLIQLRMIFGNTGNSIITQFQDTLDMSVSPEGLSGVKVGINRNVDAGSHYDLRLVLKGDSIALHEPSPVFSPIIRVDSLTLKP